MQQAGDSSPQLSEQSRRHERLERQDELQLQRQFQFLDRLRRQHPVCEDAWADADAEAQVDVWGGELSLCQKVDQYKQEVRLRQRQEKERSESVAIKKNEREAMRQTARNMISLARNHAYDDYGWVNQAYSDARRKLGPDDMCVFIVELGLQTAPVTWETEIRDHNDRFGVQRSIDPRIAAHMTYNTIRAIDAWRDGGAIIDDVDVIDGVPVIAHPLYLRRFTESVDVVLGIISSIMRDAGIKNETELTEILWNKLLDTSHPEMMSYGMQREVASRQRHDALVADVHDALDSAGVPPCDRSMEARLAALKFSPQNMRASFEDDIAAS